MEEVCTMGDIKIYYVEALADLTLQNFHALIKNI